MSYVICICDSNLVDSFKQEQATIEKMAFKDLNEEVKKMGILHEFSSDVLTFKDMLGGIKRAANANNPKLPEQQQQPMDLLQVPVIEIPITLTVGALVTMQIALRNSQEDFTVANAQIEALSKEKDQLVVQAAGLLRYADNSRREVETSHLNQIISS